MREHEFTLVLTTDPSDGEAAVESFRRQQRVLIEKQGQQRGNSKCKSPCHCASHETNSQRGTTAHHGSL
jgi:hypothetical protein